MNTTAQEEQLAVLDELDPIGSARFRENDGIRQRERAAKIAGEIADTDTIAKGQSRQTIWLQLIVVLAIGATALAIWKDMSGWAIGGAVFIALIAVAALGGHVDGIYKLRGKIDRLNAELTILRELPLSDATDSSSYFQNLVTINVTNLKEYYFLVKQHTNGSFRAAIGAGVIGFCLILLGLLAGYLKSQPDAITYIATGAGLVTEFISGIFFFLYNKTVRQLKEYHDSLLDVQNVLLSLKLLESVDDPALRAPMITRMLEYLMGVKARTPIANVAEGANPALQGTAASGAP